VGAGSLWLAPTGTTQVGEGVKAPGWKLEEEIGHMF